MKKLFLSQGKTALVDDKDFEQVSRWKWSAQKSGSTFYVKRTAAGNKKVYLHRFVLSITDKRVVDHLNGNGLDNRRKNLRVCTQKENMLNVRCLRNNNKSGVNGVSWNEQKKKWVAKLCRGGKQIYLGRFVEKKDAVRAVRLFKV